MSIQHEQLNQIVVFSINQQRYALPLSIVERIIGIVEVTPLPKAPTIVLGIINMQGRIISVLNMRRRFHLPEREIYLSDQLIIVHTSERSVALLVDNVSGVIEYSGREVVAAEAIIPGIEYVKGIIKLEDGINLILNIDTLLSIEEVRSLDDAVKEPHGGEL